MRSHWDDQGFGNVTNMQIRFMVKYGAEALGYPVMGIPVKCIDTHSLQSGVVSVLKLLGHLYVGIKKTGC